MTAAEAEAPGRVVRVWPYQIEAARGLIELVGSGQRSPVIRRLAELVYETPAAPVPAKQ